jgi:hypothetical protein
MVGRPRTGFAARDQAAAGTRAMTMREAIPQRVIARQLMLRAAFYGLNHTLRRALLSYGHH